MYFHKKIQNEDDNYENLFPLRNYSDDKKKKSLENFAIDMQLEIQNLLHSKLLTDVIIQVETEKMEWKMHRIILAASIPYFRLMFTSSMSESKLDIIVMHNVDGVSLGKLLNYAYTGEIELNEMNVLEVLNTANLLDIKDVILQCCDFVELNIHESNCLELLETLKIFQSNPNCENLYKYIQNYVMKNFENIYNTSGFLHLSLDILIEVLSSDLTLVVSEDIIFKSAINWLTYSNTHRLKYSFQVFECVRFPLMESKFLADVVQPHPLILNCPELMPLLLEAYQYLNSIEIRNSMKSKRTLLRQEPPKLYAVGGNDGNANLTIVECYNPRTCKWNLVCNMSEARNGHGVVSCGSYLYAAGGYDAMHQRLRSVERYDSKKECWNKITPMIEKRSGHTCVVLNGMIYAIGGYDPIQERLQSVERYDPSADKWEEVAPMSESRSGHGSGILNGKIYTVGGFNSNHRRLGSMELYEPETNSWKDVCGLKDTRSGHGVIGLNGYLYVVGGQNVNKLALSSVERFNPENQTWSPVADMLIPRNTVGVVSLDGFLYALGGYDGKRYISSVEYYNPITNQWSFAPNMICPRASIGAVYNKNYN